MDGLKKGLNISLVVLAILGTIATIIFGYYRIFVHDTTVGVYNIGDQIAVDIVKEDELTAEEIAELEERWFLEANYYSNAKGNGEELKELNLNYFTSFALTQDSYRSTGMQWVGEGPTLTTQYTWNPDKDAINNKVWTANNLYYYDTVDGISFNGFSGADAGLTTPLNRNQEFTIKIDNRAFMIKLDGSKITYKRVGFQDYKVKYNYSYADLFVSVMNAIKSNSAGYGDYYITLDLSSMFSIKEYDPATGKYYSDNVTDIIKNYAVLKFHYDENGAVRSTQSMFGRIANNAVVGENNVEYWQERMVFNLTEEDLTYRYSESYGGYFISLNLDIKDALNKMPRAMLNLDLDFTSEWMQDNGYNVDGFDYSGFESYHFDKIKITSAPCTLEVMNKAFKDATVTTWELSDGVVLENLNYGEDVIV